MDAIEEAVPLSIRDTHGHNDSTAECIGVWVLENGNLSFASKHHKIYCLNKIDISKRDNEPYLSTMSNGGLITNSEYQGNGMNDISKLIICDDIDELKQVINSTKVDELW